MPCDPPADRALLRIEPLHATPGTLPTPAVEDRWAFEVKQDAQRVMIYLPGDGAVLVRSRSGAGITAAYPDSSPFPRAAAAARR